MTVPQITAVTMLAIFLRPPEYGASVPKGRLQDSAGSALALAGRWLAKIVLLGSIVFLLIGYGDAMPGAVRHYAYSFGLYAFVGFLMDGPAAVAVEALGLQVIPTFDQPWLSSSLADFWGRRWNIPTTSVLRTVVYDTIVDGCLVNPLTRRSASTDNRTTDSRTQPPPPTPPTPPRASRQGEHRAPSSPAQHQQPEAKPSEAAQPGARKAAGRPSMLRRQLGLHATFLVSGMVHEYIAWLVMNDGRWGWKWTLFFYIQAPLMSLEGLAGRALSRAGVQLPRRLTNLLTLAALELFAYDLFFGFVEWDTDLAPRVIAAVSASYRGLLAPLQPLLASLAAGVAQQ